jgi:MFS family permease
VVLTIALTAQFMAMLDTNIVNVAAATIRAELDTSGAALQLVLAGYTIAYAVLLITGARTGSRIGYRKAFLLGLLVFTVASAAGGLARSTVELIAFRFAQGVGAALCIPQVFSLIQRHFTGTARARALGWYAAVISIGVLAGQILGGVLVSADLWGLSWRPIFLINVPVGVVLLVLGRRLLPADERLTGSTRPPLSRARRPERGLDLPGLALLTLAVLGFVVALLFGRWWLLAPCALLVGAFVAVQRSARTPLMPARLFRAPGLLLALAALVAMMVSYGGYMFTVALQLQTGLGYSPLRAGLSFVPNAVAFGITGMLWQRLPARWHRPMVPLGLTAAALSTVVLAVEFANPSAFLVIQLFSGAASALAFSPLMTRALARVEPADAADASGLLTTNVQLAQVLGIATIGSLYLASNITLSLLACAVATGTAGALAAAMPGPGGRSRQ